MTGDLFDRLQGIKERCDAYMAKEERRKKKLIAEVETMETQLLLADALSALRLVSTRNMSEGQRHQIAGVKKRINEALARAS